MSYSQHTSAAAQLIARCALVTLSDTRTVETDSSGKIIRDLLISAQHSVVEYQIIKDEPAVFEPMLNQFLSRPDIDAILTNGGTGVSPRNQTIPVIEKIIDTPLDGFGELFRMLSYQQIASGAMLSRAVAGISRGKLIFAMPGSTKAVELAMTKLILPEIKHLLHELRK